MVSRRRRRGASEQQQQRNSRQCQDHHQLEIVDVADDSGLVLEIASSAARPGAVEGLKRDRRAARARGSLR